MTKSIKATGKRANPGRTGIHPSQLPLRTNITCKPRPDGAPHGTSATARPGEPGITHHIGASDTRSKRSLERSGMNPGWALGYGVDRQEPRTLGDEPPSTLDIGAIPKNQAPKARGSTVSTFGYCESHPSGPAGMGGRQYLRVLLSLSPNRPTPVGRTARSPRRWRNRRVLTVRSFAGPCPMSYNPRHPPADRQEPPTPGART